MDIIRKPGTTFLKTIATLPTPALVYDLGGIEHTISALRKDLRAIKNLDLFFAIKANRCPKVLSFLANQGLGADIASIQEFESAKKACMKPISATSPFFSIDDFELFIKANVDVDLDNTTQIRKWFQAFPEQLDIGLRITVPIPLVEAQSKSRKLSRFGVNPTDKNLHQYIQKLGCRVRRLHIHAGEYRNTKRAKALFSFLENCIEVFPDLDLLNLGGGLTQLYANQKEALATWSVLANIIKKLPKQMKIIIEPGMLLTALSGYLVTSVVALEERPHGYKVATLDSSAWNLTTWAVPQIIYCQPERYDNDYSYDIVGCTCYENDIFMRNINLPQLSVGDKLIMSGMGAYVSSMYLNTHGLRCPQEWVYSQGSCFLGG